MNTTTKHKHGDIRGDGFFFSDYNKAGREHWISPQALKLKKEKAKVRALVKHYETYSFFEKNPLTFERTRKYGEVRDDGYRFDSYKIDGKERWRSPQSWEHQTKKRLKKVRGIHKISYDYPDIDLTIANYYKG